MLNFWSNLEKTHPLIYECVQWGISKYFDYVDPEKPELKEVYKTKQ